MNKSAIRAFGIAIFLVGALLTLASRFDVNIGLPIKDFSNQQQVEALQNKLKKANQEIASLKDQLKQVHTTEKLLRQMQLNKLVKKRIRMLQRCLCKSIVVSHRIVWHKSLKTVALLLIVWKWVTTR